MLVQSWGSVYYFCGDELQYCTCSLRWNAAGWAKACFLSNFVLAAALGWQKLVIQVGLDGLLAGEASSAVDVRNGVNGLLMD